MKTQYLVEFDPLNSIMSPEFLALIPQQEAEVQELLREEKLLSYAMSANRSRIWMSLWAESDFKVLEIIARLPLSEHMLPSIHVLSHCEVASSVRQASPFEQVS